ncbi:hypothetical protein LTR10_017506 [Elasticomyces elasticus]|uniref:NAD(P)-binding domain-containing protein n=1 Tax=Exophiala sideris TaxID=1016849 RepID=A0ABR0IZC2_9EURO|nr:hypothetical protein LTR10_017506 [Elasticomyces elasticus]KAK5023489.1 hypothetical protein LTS07_009364 [Exophiala sideris]KAK5028136.1 hypothetical protein LTR13_009124 [Exophiala sideris]KAK5052794.1 hypothetical protein LTR69_009620 [Exophiala sideris]KAK5178405.1 hypothetical protein LTR44_009030 [Eurotiomycetes sp. CCFEE 6388]
MSASGKSVFLIGPGFIGRNVVDLLLAEGYNVTTLVRRESQAAELQKDGVSTVFGTLSDSETITKQTIASDIVFHIATADDLPSVQAVIEGVKSRAQAGKPTIYIHTSGTSLIGDKSAGQYKADKIFSDNHPQDIDALPDTAPHRQIDLAIVRARKELGTGAKLAIMIPPLIYGINQKYKRLSIQLPTLTRFALKHGYAGQVGKGASVWSTVHVLDLARAYITLLHWLEQTPAEKVLENPYFFCESGHEFAWTEGSATLGQALHAAGRIKDPEPRTIPEEDYKDIFGGFTAEVAGSNSRSRANRLRQLGWEPREKGVLESFKDDEIPLLLQETGEFNGYGGAVAS